MTSLLPVPASILVVGGGGREHALAWRLAGEESVREVVVAPGSDAIATLPRVRVLPDVRATDPASVLGAARQVAANLVVIGPEAPLAAGVADLLASAGVPVFGPTAAAARIESSKAFCHAVAQAAGIPMATARAFAALAPARAYAAILAAGGRGLVVKADGLASGKGVTVCDGLPEAEEALVEVFADGDAADGTLRVVVEERLYGPEASVIAVCDGRDALALPAARDHKRLGDGDSGPNTGGMGAYSPLPDMDDVLVATIVARFHRAALAELAGRGIPFRGALYAGLILTEDRGPVLLEYNARFGDPETQAILPLVGVPLAPLLLAAAQGRLAAAAEATGLPGLIVPALHGASVAIVLAGGDYPAASTSGDPITGLAAAAAAGALVFHAGTRHSATGWQTEGGRILAVVGRGPDLADARAAAEAAADAVSFPGARRRHDIAASAVAARPVPALPAPAGRGAAR